MNGDLFSAVHSSITSLLTLQKKNQPIGYGLTALRKALVEESSKADSTEVLAVCSALIVGIRVLADGSLHDESLPLNIEQYASIIDFAFTTGGLQLSIKWAEHVRPLLTIFLSYNSGSNHCTQVTISAVKKILLFAIANSPTSPDIFSESSIPLFGKLVSVCLDIITADSQSTEARQIAAEIIHIISCQDTARNSLSIVLPGLCSRISGFLSLASRVTNNRIILLSIEAMFNSISCCLQDESFETSPVNSANKKLFQGRNLLWAEEAAAKLSLLITNILAHLSQHPNEEIRFALVSGLSQVVKCEKAFGQTLRPASIDLSLIFLEDQHKNIADSASELLESVKSPETIIYITERLSEMTKNLPSAVIVKVDSSPALKQIKALLIALDKNLKIMATTKSPIIINLLQALATIIRINFKRLNVCAADVDSAEVMMLAIPLNYNVDMNLIKNLCCVIGKSADHEIIEIMIDDMRNCSKGDQIAYHIMLYFIIEQLPTLEYNISYEKVSELCCQELTEIPAEHVLNDSLSNEQLEAPDESAAYSITVLACLLSSIKKLNASNNRILMHSIYKILEFCSSSKWIVSEVAAMILKDLSQFRRISISALLLENNSYVLSSITLCCRSFEAHLSAPLAFESFLNRVDNPAAFEVVQNIVSNLLTALDIHKQEWIWIILRSLKAFIIAVNRWFPCIQRSLPDADDDEEEKIPKQILLVEKILNRTKFMLSSKALPVRIVSMSILLHGVHFLRDFDNQLLPMVHQNWVVLVNRWDDKELESRRVALSVVVEMAKTTKTFVYRKVMLELWPRIAVWLQNNVQKKTAFPQTSAFRLCETIIVNLNEALINIGVTQDDWQKIYPILELYLAENVHPLLVNKAKSLILQVNKYLDTI